VVGKAVSIMHCVVVYRKGYAMVKAPIIWSLALLLLNC